MGEIAAHFDEVYGAKVSDIDAIMVKVRDGQVSARPAYAAVGVSCGGESDILGLWIGDGKAKVSSSGSRC